MLNQIFATKLEMSQAWTNDGKRLAITKCKVEENRIITIKSTQVKTVNPDGQKQFSPCQIAEIGYGQKKLARMTKPLRQQITKAGFDGGAKQIQGVRELGTSTDLTVGSKLNIADILQVGDVVEVQGTSKGKGFAGVMKRHNFRGGPATHGQSDRARAPGSIGQRTQPGRVHKGHRMAGHMGSDTVTVSGLIVVHLDTTKQEVWLSGPIPGANQGIVRLSKTGENKAIALNLKASGIQELKAPVEVDSASEVESAPVEVETKEQEA